MALILNIDTAVETAIISLAEDGKLYKFSLNESMKDHAAWIQPAIYELMSDAGYKIGDLNAVGISIGPGSYTGLRIGLSTAKGLCYALQIPLITINSLEIMAASAIDEITKEGSTGDLLYCPMIDARRMEVFTAIYHSNLSQVTEPHACMLNTNSFEDLLKRQKILFLGNGSIKFQKICQNPNAIFKKLPLNQTAFCTLTYKNFIGNNFAILAYTEPLYLKEFFTSQSEPRKK